MMLRWKIEIMMMILFNFIHCYIIFNFIILHNEGDKTFAVATFQDSSIIIFNNFISYEILIKWLILLPS